MHVIILGGGIVGLTAANLLARQRAIEITLITSQLPESTWNRNAYDPRCSAITRAAQNVFADLGIWDDIVRQRVGVYDKMLVWDQLSNAQVSFNAKDIGEPDLGHIIENRVMQKPLYNMLMQAKNVTIIKATPNKLQQLSACNRLWLDNRSIECDLIIGADGANSWLRSAAYIPTIGWDYAQTALVATIRSQFAHANTAMQRFSHDGTLAFLPLDDKYLSSIVWSTSPDNVQQLMRASHDEFCQQLSNEFAVRLGQLELCGTRLCFPLRMHHAKTYISSRLALIGDAAHGINPLAGQGLNLGILDAHELVAVLRAAIARQRDIGASATLRKYELRRKQHNIAMLSVVETLQRTFITSQPGLAIVRAHGMRLINNMDWVKNSMMRYALGI